MAHDCGNSGALVPPSPRGAGSQHQRYRALREGDAGTHGLDAAAPGRGQTCHGLRRFRASRRFSGGISSAQPVEWLWHRCELTLPPENMLCPDARDIASVSRLYEWTGSHEEGADRDEDEWD